MKIFKKMEQLQIHILLLLLMCAGLVMSMNRRESGDTPICNIEDPVLKRELRHCIKKGDRFIRKYFKELSKKKGKSGCSLFTDAHECFGDLFAKCSASRNLLSPDWLKVYDVMACQCSNASQECAQAVPCFEGEHQSILSVRCDDYLVFNKRMETRHHCHFIHENIQCKQALVKSHCGDYAGAFAFHLYKYKEDKNLKRPHHCPHLHKDAHYNGFSYSEQCPPSFSEELFQCENFLLQNEVHQAFHDANDLVFAKDADAVHSACRDYNRYEECRRPLKERCHHGVKILEDYEEQIRTLRMKLQFICVERKDAYVANLPCYKEVIENGTLKVCGEKFDALKPIMQDVKAHQFYCQRNSNGTQRLLSALGDLRICYEETFVGACGNEGGTVMSGLMTEAFRDPLYLRYSYEPDCSLHTPDEHDLKLELTTSEGAGEDDRDGHGKHRTHSRGHHTDSEVPRTDPTGTDTKVPWYTDHKDTDENEVLDEPAAGRHISSASCVSVQKFHLTFVTLTLSILWFIYPT